MQLARICHRFQHPQGVDLPVGFKTEGAVAAGLQIIGSGAETFRHVPRYAGSTPEEFDMKRTEENHEKDNEFLELVVAAGAALVAIAMSAPLLMLI